MVLDDDCVVHHNLEHHVMGEVKCFSSIPNLYVLLAQDGFKNMNVVYIEGQWVMIDLKSAQAKKNFMQHIGVASWFLHLRNAQLDFVSKDRVVWVDIEGVPLHGWTSATFNKIGSKWGKILDLEEGNDSTFARKRLCIKTNQEDIILDKLKIIIRGKVFIIRAKELFTWSPVFKEIKEVVINMDDEYIKDDGGLNDDANSNFHMDNNSDVEAVSDTCFGDNGDDLEQAIPNNGVDMEQAFPNNAKESSPDPFNVYDLLQKHDGRKKDLEPDSSISHPPGFTQANDFSHVEVQEGPGGNFSARVYEKVQPTNDQSFSDNRNTNVCSNKGGSILDALDDMIKIVQVMGYDMNGCLGSKAKKDWTKELVNKHRINFLSLQETKMEYVSVMEAKFLWGNSYFDFKVSEANGNSGGILCIWDSNMFLKEHHILPDNFVALYGTWVSTKSKLLIISIYAPQSRVEKRQLWNYVKSLISRFHGECILMGDFNEVRNPDERMGSIFNPQEAADFNDFISSTGLCEVQLEGYLFTWSHPSASKMSKLDRFLVTDGILTLFPNVSAVCLDKHLSDHRSILLHDVPADYGPTPFRFYQSWTKMSGFVSMVSQAWMSFDLNDNNEMIRFKKKLQALKKVIRVWVADFKKLQSRQRSDISDKLRDIDIHLDQGDVNDDILLDRMRLMKQLQDIKSLDSSDYLQKAKIQWAIEGDENSKFFHGVINRRRSNLAVKESSISGIEIRNAVWSCGENKSPGPDGFTFDFFQKFWDVLGKDFSLAVLWFFDHCAFAKGCNSSFIALIPTCLDPKSVNDYRPISLIGSLYKVVTKILATRLSSVLHNLISEVQSAFLPNKQILDGPFILNELLSWCKLKKKHAMIFKVDFAKAYDSIRWDFLKDVLCSFGFGSKWRSWITGNMVESVASDIGCSSMSTLFKYLGVMVGDNMARVSAWDDVVRKIKLRLSNWKVKTLSMGGRLTLLKSVLGATLIFWIDFFNGVQGNEKKISWVKWTKVLSEKKFGGLGVSSFFALNRALLFKWAWRFISDDNSLWSRVISAIHGPNLQVRSSAPRSLWCAIIREIQKLKNKGVDLISFCKKKVGNGIHTKFWHDVWIGDQKLSCVFPRLFALDEDKDCNVASKFHGPVELSSSQIWRIVGVGI
nr:RNA-directed DNA polymerase, eukaryota [Tanacetum cinerariifolium]